MNRGAIETEESNDLGSRIRAFRLKRGLTVKAVAEEVGVTPGFVSQVEHNRVAPSIDSLRRIAKAVGVPLFHLLIDEEAPNEVVRSFERPHVSIPGKHLEYTIISAQPERTFGVMMGTLGPNEASSDELNAHSGEECIVVQAGRVHLEMPHVSHELEEGDSIYFSSTVPHRLHNQSSRPCEFMLIVSPPRF